MSFTWATVLTHKSNQCCHMYYLHCRVSFLKILMLTLWYDLWTFVGEGLCTDSWIIHSCGGVHATWICSTQVVWGVASGSVAVAWIPAPAMYMSIDWEALVQDSEQTYTVRPSLNVLWSCWPIEEDHWPEVSQQHYLLQSQGRSEARTVFEEKERHMWDLQSGEYLS